MRRSTPRYDINFIPASDGTPVVVHASLTADEATLLFAVEMQRFLSSRTDGELEIRRKTSKSGKPDVVVRQGVISPYARR